MNGAASKMFGGPAYKTAVRHQPQFYPLEEHLGRPGAEGPRRPPPRPDRQPPCKKGDNTTFEYESDDSSLSSNASGSAKSSYQGEIASNSHSSDGAECPNALGLRLCHRGREWRHRKPRCDYRPRPRIAPGRFLNGTYPFQIKFTPDDLLNGSKYDTLSQEIWDKFVISQQTEETFKKKMHLWRYLYVTIKTIFPRHGLYVVGSTMSGFGLDSSDMDLCLFVRPSDCGGDARAHALLHLSYMLAHIRNFDPSAELIQAKVPILKFVDGLLGVQVDLNCNNVVGIRNTNLLYCYSRLDWRVRPLVVITKLWARAHNINDARQRTLSSYSITLMVIHFLQCGAMPAVLPVLSARAEWWESGAEGAHRSNNRQPLAELFLHLLRYYAHFQYEKLAVSVRAGRAIPVAECRAARSPKNDPSQWKLLCVEEPFELSNTALSVYDPDEFERVVATFRASSARLARTLKLADAWPDPAR